MKICFWGDVAGALSGKTPGGGELQIALLARALAKIGHEVVAVDYEISEEYQTEEGIRVYPIEGWNNGIRMVRTLTHKLPKLYSALTDQKADVYYCRIRDYRHILVYWAARKVKAKFILGLASDLDILSFRTRWKHYYMANLGKLYVFFDGVFGEIVYPWLLHKSDIIFVQHIGQKEILLKHKINSVVLSNMIDLDEVPEVSDPVRKDFIYVGSLDKRKGFVEFFELIKRSPLHSFKVVGQPRDKTGSVYYEKLKSFENVSLLGRLNHSDTMYQIANSKALISTSPMEGFPNVFIEAWACGVPVLSLYVDPGGIINKEELGEVTDGSLDRLITAMDNVRNTDEFSKRAKAYVEHNHVLNDYKIKEISSLFNGFVDH